MWVVALMMSAASFGQSPSNGIMLMKRATPKSMQQFTQCFIAREQGQARPLWIVPNEGGGGRISNDGARDVTNPYFIRFTESVSRNTVEVSLSKHDPAEEQSVLLAAESCS